MQSKEVLLVLTDKWADWEASYSGTNAKSTETQKATKLNTVPDLSLLRARAVARNLFR